MRMTFLDSVSHRGRFKRHALPLIGLVLLVLLAYPWWAMQAVPGFDDLSRLNGPQRALLPWFYLHGHWPLWNPFSFAGQPFLAAGQSGPLYILNIVFIVLPVVAALKVSYLIHLWIAAVGMYLAVYQLCKSRVGGMVGGTAFVTCGFMVGHQIHTQMFDAFSWLPVCFWLALLVLSSPCMWRVCALAICFALEVYAGHPQMTFYIGLTVVAYTVLELVQHRTRHAALATGCVWLALAIGMGLSAAQWLPTLNLVHYSSRTDASANFLLRGSMPPEGLFQFLTPYAQGGGLSGVAVSPLLFANTFGSSLFWEFTCYIGVSVLVVAVASACGLLTKRSAVLSLTVIGVLCAALSFGAYGVLPWLLVHGPGFNLFRIPARYIGITDFSIALLAGIGVGFLQDADGKLRQRLQWLASIIAVAMLAALAVGTWVGPIRHLPKPAVVLSGALCAVTLVLVWPRWGAFWPVRRNLLMCVMLADVVSQSAGLSTYVLAPRPASYAVPSDIVHAVQGEQAGNPFARVADLGADALGYDMAAAFQIPALNGYDSLVPALYDQSVGLTWSEETLRGEPRSLMDALDVHYVVTPAAYHPLVPTDSAGRNQWSHWWSVPKGTSGFIVKVSSALGDGAVSGPLFSITVESGNIAETKVVYGPFSTSYYVPLRTKVYDDRSVRITIKNEQYQGAVHIDALQTVGSQTPGLLGVQTTLSPLPWQSVYSNGRLTVWRNPDAQKDAWVAPDVGAPLVSDDSEVTLQSVNPNEERWKVSHSGGGWLVVSQMFDPNWHVTVDGRQADVQAFGEPYAGVLTAVKVPPGSHEVRMWYMPKSFQVGLVVSLLTAIVVLALMIRGKVRKRGPV